VDLSKEGSLLDKDASDEADKQVRVTVDSYLSTEQSSTYKKILIIHFWI